MRGRIILTTLRRRWRQLAQALLRFAGFTDLGMDREDARLRYELRRLRVKASVRDVGRWRP